MFIRNDIENVILKGGREAGLLRMKIKKGEKP
jgi:hypothetical protein